MLEQKLSFEEVLKKVSEDGGYFFEYIKTLNPLNFDVDQILELIKNAGPYEVKGEYTTIFTNKRY